MSDVPQDAWFYTREGERMGPLTFGDLKIRVSEGLIDPRNDMVWTVGMETWKPAGEIEGLFERRVAEAPVQSSMAETPNPYESGSADSENSLMGKQGEWPGFGRAIYFIGSIILGFASGAIPPLIAPFAKGYEAFLLAIPILVVVLWIWLGLQRLTNVGMSRWWYLGNLVPLLHLWVAYRMAVCPAGYAFHKKLDGAGIFLAILYWLGMIAMILGVIGIVLILSGALGDPQMKQQFLEELRKAQQAAPAR